MPPETTLYDISQTLRPDLPVWPGDVSPALSPTWMIGPGCPVNVSKLSLSTHSGAHADAPLHYNPTGADSAGQSLVPFLGPCRMIDARSAGPLVQLDHIAPALHNAPPRILLRTYQRFPHDQWRPDWSAVCPNLITHLAAIGAILIGIDGPSLDPQDSKTMDAHQAVSKAGLSILEGLVLDHVPPGDYELIALPLKLAGADASPVRAVLRPLPTQGAPS